MFGARSGNMRKNSAEVIGCPITCAMVDEGLHQGEVALPTGGTP